MRRTKIVATLGPAVDTEEKIRELIESGVDVVRLNLSHGTHEYHHRFIEMVKAVSKTVDKKVGILLDTRGPEIRVGKFAEGSVALKEGQSFVLTSEAILGTTERVSVTYPELSQDVKLGDQLLLDDGNLVVVVKEIKGVDIHCEVAVGGVLKDNKRVALPGIRVNLPALTEDDISDIIFGIEEGVDFVAASFMRTAEDVLAVRKVLEDSGGTQSIIAKIENEEGVSNLDEILEVADGLMVARGDLGVEVPAEEVPLIQKTMIEKANLIGKPVITATQMLESMIEHSRPTRAEASDVANAIIDGTDAVMLSGETAVGKYPFDAVKFMDRIARRTEAALPYVEILKKRGHDSHGKVTDAISYASCTAASNLGAKAIITATQSGHTSRMVARYRPESPVIAVTPSEKVCRQLQLIWGVVPMLVRASDSTDELVEDAVKVAVDSGLVAHGDLVIITAGVPVGIPGTTNLLKVHTVGDAMLQGKGIGKESVTGKVVVIRRPEDAKKFEPGDIIVTYGTDKDMVPYIEQSGGIVAEEGGLTSHAALVGLNFGLAVIVGAKRATDVLVDGEIVTLDPIRGLVYKGKAEVR